MDGRASVPPLTVVVLTQDEEANLPPLLASLGGLDCRVFVVDSGSTDRTVAIAEAAGCTVVAHPFESYAAQRNWSFDHLPIDSPWVLSMDADERLTSALRDEIARVVAAPVDAVPIDGYMLKKQIWFMGRWLRHGGQYPFWHLRLARTGRVRCEKRLYDQHYLVDGRIGRLEHDCIDVLTDDMSKWIGRLNWWATLEATEVAGGPGEGQVQSRWNGTPIERKRFLRNRIYHAFPLFVRPFLLFFIDYVLRGGFLDGRRGLAYHVLQRFWFHFLVDVKLYEMQRRRSSPREVTVEP